MGTASTSESIGDGGISDEAIAEVRELIGKPLRINQFNHEATYDTIRHWCFGTGDDNPLWNDAEYAANGPYGTIVAPPTFLYSVFGAGIQPGFPGFMGLHGGGRWEFGRYVKRGERIIAEARLIDLKEARGKRVGRIMIGTGETTYRTPEGEFLGKYISIGIRRPRPGKDGVGKLYEPQDPYEYSQEELDRIEQHVLTERRRGAEPLYWEDVSIGEEVPTRVKGPLDSGTMISWQVGVGPSARLPADTAWKWRELARRAPEKLPNNHPFAYMVLQSAPTGRNSAAGEGHQTTAGAQAVGMPGMYDVGWQRIAWMTQVLTDWIGDHGRVKMIDVRIDLPNVGGDTTWCKAVVTHKNIAGVEHFVDLDVSATRQDGAISANGRATVVLPSKP